MNPYKAALRAIYPIVDVRNVVVKISNIETTVSDFSIRSVKSKHNTRTKRTGITFYTDEIERYLQKYLASRKDNIEKLFRIDKNIFYRMWKLARKLIKTTPQILRKWQSTTLGENGCPDRYVDIFQERAPRTVLAKFYIGKELLRLKSIYNRFSKWLQILD